MYQTFASRKLNSHRMSILFLLFLHLSRACSGRSRLFLFLTPASLPCTTTALYCLTNSRILVNDHQPLLFLRLSSSPSHNKLVIEFSTNSLLSSVSRPHGLFSLVFPTNNVIPKLLYNIHSELYLTYSSDSIPHTRVVRLDIIVFNTSVFFSPFLLDIFFRFHFLYTGYQCEWK